LYGIGSGDFCRFLTEDNHMINAENSNRIISSDPKDHGTRIEIANSAYELFDSYRVVKGDTL
jgi:hypothetical protein